MFDEAPARRRMWMCCLTLDNVTLGFVDPRHLGRMNWHESVESTPSLNKLGVDIFSREFTLAALAAIFEEIASRGEATSDDQAKLAGLGNIYSSEALWHARLNPRRAQIGSRPPKRAGFTRPLFPPRTVP